jgi:non-heme chloroperoxidase
MPFASTADGAQIFYQVRGDGQPVALAGTAPRTASLLSDATLKIYPDGSHGLTGELEAQFNHGLLNLIRA